jgi:hypothetical protein
MKRAKADHIHRHSVPDAGPSGSAGGLHAGRTSRLGRLSGKKMAASAEKQGRQASEKNVASQQEALSDDTPLRVFLNIAFDKSTEPLALAYLASTTCLLYDLELSSAVTNPGKHEELVRQIAVCQVSLHDLSFVKRSPRKKGTSVVPRFNMPYECGIATAISALSLDPKPHRWVVFESVPGRLAESLSDFAGRECIHHGTQIGVIKLRLFWELFHVSDSTFPRPQFIASCVS